LGIYVFAFGKLEIQHFIFNLVNIQFYNTPQYDISLSPIDFCIKKSIGLGKKTNLDPFKARSAVAIEVSRMSVVIYTVRSINHVTIR